MHKRFMNPLALCLVLAVAATADEGRAKLRIVLVGDSTVTDSAGWGKAFARRLRPGIECLNMARGGQSSKSFRDGGWWQKALDAKPDYVLIQFGHNDMPGKGPNRETDPATTYRRFLSQYVDEARAAGARPILVTSVVRRTFDENGKLVSKLTGYAEAAEAVAHEKHVPLVDLHGRSFEQIQEMGPKAAAALGPPHPTLTDRTDGTHFNDRGAALTAELVIDELRKVEPSSKAWFQSDAPPGG